MLERLLAETSLPLRALLAVATPAAFAFLAWRATRVPADVSPPERARTRRHARALALMALGFAPLLTGLAVRSTAGLLWQLAGAMVALIGALSLDPPPSTRRSHAGR